MTKYKPRETSAILSSLTAGVVPNIGVQHILVGREKEIDSILQSFEEIKNGNSILKFWIGDFGSGKSFMLNLLNTLALKNKFVTAKADLTPETRLYSNDGKAVAVYSQLINSLSIQTKPEGNALPTIIEKWIETILLKIAEETNKSPIELRDTANIGLVQSGIIKTLNQITDVGGLDFGLVLSKYFEGYSTDDDNLKRAALRWLRGEYTTKTEAKNDLRVRDIIDDSNYYDMLKNFSHFFKQIGYSGFIVNIDEAINLYKITNSAIREKNYEKILTIYNDTYQGHGNCMMFNIAGTNEFLSNERRGLYSYQALKTRLAQNKYETNEIRDFTQPVIKMLPLDHDEIFVLLTKIKDIFDFNYSITIDFNHKDIHSFMEEIYNKPGAGEFLTPREIIKELLNVLNILRQNPEVSKQELFSKIEVKENSIADSSTSDIEIL